MWQELEQLTLLKSDGNWGGFCDGVFLLGRENACGMGVHSGEGWERMETGSNQLV